MRAGFNQHALVTLAGLVTVGEPLDLDGGDRLKVFVQRGNGRAGELCGGVEFFDPAADLDVRAVRRVSIRCRGPHVDENSVRGVAVSLDLASTRSLHVEALAPALVVHSSDNAAGLHRLAFKW